jgi:hypothetical protein
MALGDWRLLLARLLRGDTVDPPAAGERDAVQALAAEHRVDLLASWRITDGGRDLAAWFGDAAPRIREDGRTAAIIDGLRQRELTTVLDTLAAVPGVDPLLFKGAALAHSHYPRPWLRPRVDSDILISPARTRQAFDALCDLGYTRPPATRGLLVISQAFFTRTDRFGITHALDIHWKIANWHVVSAAMSHAELSARGVALDALGAAARTVTAADALLLACLHRAAHHRDSDDLLWLYDVHLLGIRLTDAEWSTFAAAARRGGVTALCRRGLALARETFRTAVPDDVFSELTVDQHERSAIYVSKDVRLVDGLLADVRSLPLRDALRLIAEHLCPPAEYIRAKYSVRSRRGLAWSYARRVLGGVPRWFSRESWS